jgi:hypothetical protein
MKTKIMHIINIKCDKYSRKIDVTGKTETQIKELIEKHYIYLVNFIKIVEDE